MKKIGDNNKLVGKTKKIKTQILTTQQFIL